jgi:hypothetical protein
MSSVQTTKKTNYRWVICSMLFFATTVNYMGPSGIVTDVEGFHRSGISLDGCRLWRG